MTNFHAVIPEEKLTEAYRLLLEMRDNCVKHADDQYDDPKREAKREALNIAITAMGRSVPPRWISVEERLPEDEKDVAVIVKLRKGNWMYLTAFRMPYGGWWINRGSGLDYAEVTHWMPLPEPPEA